MGSSRRGGDILSRSSASLIEKEKCFCFFLDKKKSFGSAKKEQGDFMKRNELNFCFIFPKKRKEEDLSTIHPLMLSQNHHRHASAWRVDR